MKLFLIAGEPSGDKLGAALMKGLQQLIPDVEFHGIGGPLMQQQGLISLFPMDELSIMGIAEVLPKYFHLKRRIRQTADKVLTLKPDALITIDSPDFCLRVAKIVKAQSYIRTVHYVAPTVWAWRPKRAQKMAQMIDHVLALFPFEPPYMQAAGMRCDFVGHPVVSEPQANDADVQAFRQRYDIADQTPVVLVLPGSRKGEVSRLAAIFGQALKPVLTKHPDARIVVPVASPVSGLVQDLTSDWPCKPIILDPAQMSIDAYVSEKRTAFRAADVALAASGTVSLELAASATPMVIAYDMNIISRYLIRRMLLVDTVTLVNLVSETRTVPEFLGADCQPEPIGQALIGVLADPSAQLDAMRVTLSRLGQGQKDPGLRAAEAIIDDISRISATDQR
ncbi:lipid-A-disaccharide synthase [Parasulfitobacter algicola]|uniref:Lipid-A-disaccharide synthase n=1 Tax=Parasulfitobacter algicola TaxID=2614809 RepID=A0ABX2IR72_9RHOB|nr:lipid-A-disaccharide synthase [Sulfitobacter algicola]NSX55382.1 lipid-A-disaccharide synthase [Sulfitobacter algicola]